MEIIFAKTAQADLNYWKLKNEIKIQERITLLLENILINPYQGIGKPEALKYEFTGCLSRRIDRKHRIVYRIINPETIEIISLRFHYDK
ncbi:MAG: Txe/YoeB family addiction module toxin [Sediminibacterium sp.]